MTKQFAKWASKQKIPENELATALSEVQTGIFEANLGGHIYKKRIRFEGQGKSGSGRIIICYKKMTELFLFMVLQKTIKITYLPESFMHSRSFQKYYSAYHKMA